MKQPLIYMSVKRLREMKENQSYFPTPEWCKQCKFISNKKKNNDKHDKRCYKYSQMHISHTSYIHEDCLAKDYSVLQSKMHQMIQIVVKIARRQDCGGITIPQPIILIQACLGIDLFSHNKTKLGHIPPTQDPLSSLSRLLGPFERLGHGELTEIPTGEAKLWKRTKQKRSLAMAIDFLS